MTTTETLFASAAPGIEKLLADELTRLGAREVRAVSAGVQFQGDLSLAYRCCLWSRLANRVLLPLHRGRADTPDALYATIQALDWGEHLAADGSLAVDFLTHRSEITHTRYGAQRVKDAIVDQFRERQGIRPSVDRDTPDIRVNVYVFRNQARIALDLSGGSLHRRGYRQDAGQAPLKENLAAALLSLADWPLLSERGAALIDPLCGSGTLVIEAALMATGRAPGLTRSHYGFLGWRGHDAALWQSLLREADAAIHPAKGPLIGRDRDRAAIEHARRNAAAAGVGEVVEFHRQDLLETHSPSAPAPAPAPAAAIPPAPDTDSAQGLVITNPPYGERLGTDASAYAAMGTALSREFAGWQCALFTAIDAPSTAMRLPWASRTALKNGAIECELLQGRIPASTQRSGPGDASEASSIAATGIDITPFSNRVRKNLKHLSRWARREGVKAYRVYDGDLPEFAVAVDLYECRRRHLVVQEYQAPASVNRAMAEARLSAILDALPDLLDVEAADLHLRLRERQRGTRQYDKLGPDRRHETFEEQGVVYEVGFEGHLDTGIFLDHRKVRRHIASAAHKQRFLNLFAYTGAATAAAIVGGASQSVSVDLSRTYCDWAERNIRYNHGDAEHHRVVRQDVLKWLDAQAGDARYDLILLDPPTFSNSTGLDDDWNVQRDHAACIERCMRLLDRDGVLIFSNNYRRFRLDASVSQRYDVQDRSAWSIDEDFKRNPRIHQCWFLRHRQE